MIVGSERKSITVLLVHKQHKTNLLGHVTYWMWATFYTTCTGHRRWWLYLNVFQLQMRWASSTARRPTLFCEIRVRKRGFGSPEDCRKNSGVQKMMSNCPWATLAVTVVFFWVEPRNVAFRPVDVRLSTWSIIKLIVGVSTIVVFCVTVQGNW